MRPGRWAQKLSPCKFAIQSRDYSAICPISQSYVTLLHIFIMWSCICYFASSVYVYVLRICNGIHIIGEYGSLLHFRVLGGLIFIECVIWGVQAFQRLHFRVRLLVSAACLHVLHVVISGCSVTICIGLKHKNPSLFHREIDSCKITPPRSDTSRGTVCERNRRWLYYLNGKRQATEPRPENIICTQRF